MCKSNNINTESFIGINWSVSIYSISLRESGAIMVTLSMRIIMTLNASVWRNQATILRFNICWRTTVQHGPHRLLAFFNFCKLCHVSMWSSFRAANMVLYLRNVFRQPVYWGEPRWCSLATDSIYLNHRIHRCHTSGKCINSATHLYPHIISTKTSHLGYTWLS